EAPFDQLPPARVARNAGPGGGRGAVAPRTRAVPGGAGRAASASPARRPEPQHRSRLSTRFDPAPTLALGKLLGQGIDLAQRRAPVPALSPHALRAGARALPHRAPESFGPILGAGGKALSRVPDGRARDARCARLRSPLGEQRAADRLADLSVAALAGHPRRRSEERRVGEAWRA